MVFANEVYQPFQFVGDASGLDMDKVNFVICALGSYPLSLAFTAIPKSQASVRHFVGGLLGLLMCILCFRWETYHLVGHMAFSYIVMKLGGRKAAPLVFIGCMGHLMLSLLYHRTYFWGDYTLNVNGPLMVLTQKMTQLAFAVADGAEKDQSKLTPYLRTHALPKMPSLLEYFGHTFFFPSVMVGPNHHFAVYRDLIEGTGPHEKPASGLLVGLKKLGMAGFWHAWTLLPAVVFGITDSITPHRLVSGPEFEGKPNPVAEYGLVKMFAYNIMAMQIYRCGFYFAWQLAEGACNVSGLGYNGVDKDGKERWDLVTNVRPFGVEFATNFKEVLDAWNMQSGAWLRYACYERLGNHPLATYATMLLSAMWHGPYLGYFMSFMMAGLATEGNRKVRRTFRPHFMPEGSAQHKFYCVAGWAVNVIVLNYLVGPFVVLTVDGSMKFWGQFYWFVHIGYILITVLLPGKKPTPKKVEGEAKKEL